MTQTSEATDTDNVARPGEAAAASPRPAIPKKVVCPVCSTTFNVRANGGKCPVCGEQVVPHELAAANIPVASPAGKWLFQGGGWRLVALIALLVYQLVLFGVLVHHFIDVHAF